MQAGPPIIPQGSAKIAVYSCYFGAHEPFNPDATGTDSPLYDRLVFTDHDTLSTSATLVQLADDGAGPAILSRLPKLCPHLFFQGYDWVIYLDNNARFLLDPARMLRRIAKEHPDAPAGRYLFRHSRRDCAWDEVDECLRLGTMSAEQSVAVKAHFTAEAFARHAGLFVNTCLIQRMGSPETDVLNEAWYTSLSEMTRRDQVLLPWLLASQACPHRVLSVRVKSWVDWPVFSPAARARFRRRQIAA